MTPAIEDYLNKKLLSLNRLVDFDADNVFAQVELAKTSHHHKSGDIFRAEINVKIGKMHIRAVSEKEDLYAAIDDMKDELAREIKSDKEKHLDLKRKGSAEIKKMIKATDAVAEGESDDIEEEA